MCIEKSIKLKLAKRTRYFYKVLLVRGYRFYSPYRNTGVILNYPYSTCLETINVGTQIYRSKVYGDAKLFVTFAEGLFFVCRTKMAAKRLIKRDLCPSEQYIIVRAVVPKGALIINDGFQIATNCVRYEKSIVLYIQINNVCTSENSINLLRVLLKRFGDRFSVSASSTFSYLLFALKLYIYQESCEGLEIDFLAK